MNCLWCAESFYPRAGKRFCSGTCRVSHHRYRTETLPAIQAALALPLTAEEIAQELREIVESVRRTSGGDAALREARFFLSDVLSTEELEVLRLGTGTAAGRPLSESSFE